MYPVGYGYLHSMSTRERVLSVSQKDLKMDVFRAGGNGGQKQNKTNTGVRFRHEPSGAVGESREHASQLQNKKAAFRRLAESKEMQLWIRKQVAEATMDAAEKERIERQIAANVERMMHPSNLTIEVHDENGRWVEVPDASV